MQSIKYIIAGAVATTALAACALAATPSNGPANYKGVDIYHGSNVLSFAELKASGHADFAWIKRSEAERWQDPKYDAYVAGCKAAGIKWGPYHFLRLYSPESCKRQADTFWARIKDTGYSVLPAVDVESHDGQGTAAGMRACVRAFVDEFYRVAGFKPVLYTYTAYANDILRGQFSDCKLWLADYRGYAGTVTGWSAYDAWQYSGDRDHVAGIDNAADLDVGTASIFTTPASKSTTATTAAKPAAKPSKPTWPGYAAFGWGRSNNYILTLDRALIRAGYARYYKLGARGASQSWGLGTQRACAAFQRAQGWRGLGADGVPGPQTWRRLQRWM